MLVVIIPKSKVTISNYYGIIITIYNYQAWGLTLKEAVWLDVLMSINGHFSTSRLRYLVTIAEQSTTLLNDIL